MKQITMVLHYDDDSEAEKVHQLLRIHRSSDTSEPLILAIRGGRDSIRVLKLRGPNDELPTYSNCPGIPHQGHASTDWTCPFDN